MSYVPVRRVFFAMIVCLAASSARADDEFKNVELRAQKLTKEVNDALGRAKELVASDPAKATELLRQAKLQLEEDVLLAERHRRDLLQLVTTRLQIAVRAAREAQLAADEKSRQTAAKQPRPPVNDKKPTGGATDTADKFISGAKANLDAAARVKFLTERGFTNVVREVELSAAQKEEQRITDRFVMISELRKQKLDPREAAIMKALNSTVSVDFDRARFKEVMEYLSEKIGQPIIVDENSLREANLEYDDPINFKVKKATVRTILRGILNNKGLTYVIKEGTLQVMTQQRARDMMVTKTYAVSDLIRPDPRWGIYGRPLMLMNVQSLMNTIQQAVDPSVWQQQPSGASITFYEPGLALIIRAPAEVHYMMPQSFGR